MQPGDGVLTIPVERSGDWLPAEDLRQSLLQALEQQVDVKLDLGMLNHLDASALQILLSAAEQQRQRGLRLCLTHPSPELLQWFEYAGASDRVDWEGVRES